MSVGTATSLFRSHFTHTIACVGSIPIGMSITGITVKRQFCSYFLTRSICLQPSRTIECNVCIKTRFAISPLFQSLIRIALEIGSGGNYFVIIVIRPSQIFIGRHTLIFFIILVVNNPSAIFHKVQVYHFLGYTKSETASQSTAIIIVAFMKRSGFISSVIMVGQANENLLFVFRTVQNSRCHFSIRFIEINLSFGCFLRI